MNWEFLKLKKENEKLIIKETFNVSRIELPSGIYKLPEVLTFPIDTSIEKQYIEIMDYMCKRFLEKEN